MKTLNIDIINLGLILVSFVLAFFFPFELFLFSYAFFGPLHYLTETNWIINKDYFVSKKLWKYLVLIVAIIYSLPFLFSINSIQHIFNNSIIELFILYLKNYTNSGLFFILIFSLFTLYFKTYKAFLLSFVLVFVISFFFYTSPSYILIFGVLLPTIIHVFVFTLLFMIYGIKNKNNVIGIVNVVLMILLPMSLWLIDLDQFNYHFSQATKDYYLNNNFHILNANLAKLFGVYKDLKFFFYEEVDLKIQIFIAFAYLYHYLNWFSKTTVIGWHKQLTKKKSIVIIVIWLLILFVYFKDYHLGIICSIFLSVVHVMLEFPINMLTIKSLFKK